MLIQDWTKFCTGQARFDKSHFTGLFLQDLDDEELKEIFQFFPSAESLAGRLKKVKSAGSLASSPYLLPKAIATPEVLIELVKLDVKDRLLLCKELDDDELCDKLANAKFEFIFDKHQIDNLLKADNLSEVVFELIGDYIDEVRGTDPKMQALEEACYGLAANYYLAWYIMVPILDISIDFENYFNFWRNGGVFVITERGVLVSSIKL